MNHLQLVRTQPIFFLPFSANVNIAPAGLSEEWQKYEVTFLVKGIE